MVYQAVYVHIPFCVQRCNYCDFLSHVKAEAQQYAAIYPDLLGRELTLQAAKQSQPVQSVYFGGGTPTTLPAADLISILEQIKVVLPLAKDVEITVETNPATVDEAYLTQLAAAGFNRLSMGGQSFNDAELAAMGRLHRAKDIAATVAAAKNAGFQNIGVDLIYGLPGQTLVGWRHNLEQALALKVQHISLYGLQLDNQSPWGVRWQAGQLQVADEDLSADMLECAIATLTAGSFRQYEIANFALATAERDYSSRHNQSYWRRQDYLGLGLGAASCLGNKRWQTVGTLASYAAALQQNQLPLQEQEALSSGQVLGEAVFLGLRRLCGIELGDFARQYGVKLEERFAEAVQRLQKLGLLELERRQGERWLRLSHRGLFLANQVFLEFV